MIPRPPASALPGNLLEIQLFSWLQIYSIRKGGEVWNTATCVLTSLLGDFKFENHHGNEVSCDSLPKILLILPAVNLSPNDPTCQKPPSPSAHSNLVWPPHPESFAVFFTWPPLNPLQGILPLVLHLAGPFSMSPLAVPPVLACNSVLHVAGNELILLIQVDLLYL